MEQDGDSLAVSPEKFLQSNIVVEPRARPMVYTREYLLSFASLSFCQTKPDGLDSTIWREAQAADISGEAASISGIFSRPAHRDGESDSSTKSFRDIPEWRRSSVHPGGLLAQQSSRRKSYNDEPPGSPFSNNYAPKQASHWGENTQSRSNHDRQAMQVPKFMEGQEKWGHRGDRERERGRFNFNRENNGSGRKPTEHDGLLGSGESSRGIVAGGVVGLSPSSKDVGKHVLAGRGGPTSTSNDTFHYSKGTYGPRHHGTDAINDETFGEEQCSEERSEQERKRRESFELMRQESKKSMQEKQSFELEKPEEQHTSKIDQTVDKTHVEDDTCDDSRDLERMASISSSSKSLIHEPPLLGNAMKTSTLMSVPSVARPLVPPGFSEILLKANEHKSFDEEKHPEKMEEPKEEERSILKDGEDDSRCMMAEKLSQSSCSHVNLKTAKGTEGLRIERLKSSDELFDESRSVLKTSIGNTLTEVDGVGEIPGSFFLSESQADSTGDSEAKMSKFAKWFPSPDAEDKWKRATSVGDNASHILSLLSGSGNSDTTTNEASFQSFEEVNHLKDERSSSGLLLPLTSPGQVLPMPFGPSLEDIEKDMTLVANGKDENLFSLGSASKNENEVLPVYGNEPEVALPVSSLKASKVFFTCEDIEQSLLAEAEGHQEQTFFPAEISQSTTSSPLIKEGEAPNFFASQHLLSLLQKSSADSIPRGKDSQEQHFIPKEEMQKKFLVNEPSSERKQKSQTKGESASEPTLKALFGKAFMRELHSLEAPVSAQLFPDEMKAAHGVYPSDLAEVKRTSLPPDPFSHSHHLQAIPPKSTHRYYDKKGEGGFHSIFPVEHYAMHDEQGNHPTGYGSASQWPPTENPALLLDMLAAGRPSKNSFASTGVPFPTSSSVERWEREILERKASGGSKKFLPNVVADEGQRRLNAAFDNMISNASADQQFLEDLLINKDLDGNLHGQLNLRDQLFGHANRSPVIPMISGTGITSRGKIPESLFLDNAVLESVLDEVSNTGKQMNRQRDRGALGDIFSQLDTAATNAVPFKKASRLDEKSLGSHRVIDAFQQGNKEDTFQSVPYDTRRIGRTERFPKDTSTESENKFVSDILTSASASGSLNTLRVSSSQQHSHSSFPLNSLYRSHSPETTLSAGTNISLGHLQQALVSNDPKSAFPSSGGQVGRQHFHSQPEPLLHHMITSNKMISSTGLRNQQHSAAARSSSNSSVANRSHFHGHPDIFLNPNSVPQTVLPPPLLGSGFPPGQFPPQRFGPSINVHSNIHEQSPYDSHGFGMPVTGYAPSNGPLHPLVAHLNSPFHNLELHHALQMEQPIPGQGQPNIIRDFNRRLPRMPPHWN